MGLVAEENENLCGLDKRTIKRIYPILRYVAAIHEETPIKEISENENVLSVLKKAIEDNPKHFKEIIERL